MKRNREDNDDEKITKKPKNLYIENVLFLRCDVCSLPVYNYRECISPHVYCSLSCFECLFLSYFGNFHINDSFEDIMQE